MKSVIPFSLLVAVLNPSGAPPWRSAARATAGRTTPGKARAGRATSTAGGGYRRVERTPESGVHAMPRPVTLFTGQWADLPLEVLAGKAKAWGYDGLELACWGDHVEVEKAASDPNYCKQKRALLEKHGLKVFAISNHLSGQLVCDRNDARAHAFAPKETHGKPEAIRKWAVEQMKLTARAAKNLGVQ